MECSDSGQPQPFESSIEVNQSFPERPLSAVGSTHLGGVMQQELGPFLVHRSLQAKHVPVFMHSRWPLVRPAFLEQAGQISGGSPFTPHCICFVLFF
jgi:hypothetical protein